MSRFFSSVRCCEQLWVLLLFLAVTWGLSACASKASPEGGPFDQDPPKLLLATPLPNSVQVEGKRIRLQFDEIVQVKSPLTKVTLSPPQAEPPKIKVSGRNVTIELQEDLLPNTTYAIDFSDAVADIHENTPIEGFVYSFSTGDHLDNGRLSGVVVDARTLEPMEGLKVGVHVDRGDSAIITKPFYRVSTTRSDGHFSLLHLPDSCYRIYALQDIDRNYMLSPNGEGLAFDKQIHCAVQDLPREEVVDSVLSDTIHKEMSDSLPANPASNPASLVSKERQVSQAEVVATAALDSVSLISSTQGQSHSSESLQDSILLNGADTALLAVPGNLSQGSLPPSSSREIILRFFRPVQDAQKLLKSERPDSAVFVLNFAIPVDQMPEIKFPDSLSVSSLVLPVSRRVTVDSLPDSLFRELSRPTVESRPSRPYPFLAAIRENATTLRYEILSPDLSARDSIPLEVSYSSLDSLRQPIVLTDTLFLRKQKSKKTPIAQDDKKVKEATPIATNEKESKAKEKEDRPSVVQQPADSTGQIQDKRPRFELQVFGSKGIYSKTPLDTVSITSPHPIVEQLDSLICVEVKSDSIWRPFLNYQIETLPANECVYRLSSDWQWGSLYRFSIDEAVLQDYYGQVNKAFSFTLELAKEQEYGSVELEISPVADNCVVELLDNTENVLAMTNTVNGKAVFPYINAGEYYARLFIDANANGRWDTGQYPDRLPEEVYYLPKKLLVKAQWITNEIWQINELPLDEQKPEELRKTKPQEEKKDLNEEYWKRMEKRNFKRPDDKSIRGF